MLAAVTARQLKGCFVRFRAAVAKKNPLAEGVAAKFPRKLGLGRDVIEVRNVKKFARLLLNRAHDGGMAMSQRIHCDAREEIEILFPVRVPDSRPLAAHESNRISRIGSGDVLIGQPRNVAIRHRFTTSVPIPSLVKISRSTACFTRPSRMWVFPTPPLSASMQHSTFGIIPEPTTPS